MSEKNQWISIERLLDDYSIPVLAEAIDKFGIQTIDDWGRRVLANDGEASDAHSKAFAKAHLAQRRAFELNPLTEDQQYWFDERIQTHGSALDLFGWPKNQLPNLAEIQPNYQPESDPEWWTKRSAAEFEQEFISVGKNFTKAAELYGLSRQRYTKVIKAKCDESLFKK